MSQTSQLNAKPSSAHECSHQDIFEQLIEKQSLTHKQMKQVMHSIMSGNWSSEAISAFLIALRIKGETVEEIIAAAEVMRELATPVKVDHPHLIDVCGTGGDKRHLFNVSTAVSFVAAAGGAGVAKHGNRSVSSHSGAADVLEAAGVFLEITPEACARAVHDLGVGFLFAPQHHSAMKYAMAPRKALGIRTIFNLLGPLTNPAQVPRQLLGVFDPHWVRPMAEVLKGLGLEKAIVVSGLEGLDEFSIAGTSHYALLDQGKITEHEVNPEDFGLESYPLDTLVVNNADESLAIIQQALKKEPQDVHKPARDIIALNAGAALFVAGCTASIKLGVDLAQDVMASGAAREKIGLLRDFTSVLRPDA